jgi:hypothetical protein
VLFELMQLLQSELVQLHPKKKAKSNKILVVVLFYFGSGIYQEQKEKFQHNNMTDAHTY